jgi:TolB-like protein/DNA-binding SARP family transcriptional activator
MAEKLKLFLLGGFDLRLPDGQPLTVTAKKNQALLAYLALAQGMRQTRDKLVGLLWGDRGNEQARNSLRQALVALRRNLAVVPAALRLDGDTVAFDNDAVEVDAVLFERLARSERPADLRRAGELYRGPLLDGVFVQADGFDEWLTIERQRLQERAIAVLSRLLPDQTGSDAIITAQRLAQLAPASRLVSSTLERATAERDASIAPAAVPTNIAVSSGITVAVLPFANADDDPGLRTLGGGIAEDLTTELSRFHLLRVVIRGEWPASGDEAAVRRIGSELGVRYLIMGSLRRHAEELRVTVQVVDGTTGEQFWADHFDREARAVGTGTPLIGQIAATLAGRLRAAGFEAVRRKPAAELTAQECVLRGLVRNQRLGDRQAEPEIHELATRAVALDPGYGRAHAVLACAGVCHWFADGAAPDAELDEALESAKNAVALDNQDSECHFALGWVHLHRKSFELAEQYYRRAIELNPNSPDERVAMGGLYAYLGRPDEALDLLQQARRLDPFYDPTWYWHLLGAAYFTAHRYDDAIAALSRSTNVPLWGKIYVAACRGHQSHREAAAIAAEILRARPEFSAAAMAAREPYKDQAHREHLLDGLLKAGLPA